MVRQQIHSFQDHFRFVIETPVNSKLPSAVGQDAFADLLLEIGSEMQVLC